MKRWDVYKWDGVGDRTLPASWHYMSEVEADTAAEALEQARRLWGHNGYEYMATPAEVVAPQYGRAMAAC